jgi:phage I-like protein
MPAASSLAAHLGLITLQACSRLDAAAELPTRIVMMKWGRNETAQGPMTVGLKTLQASAKWDAIGYGEVAIDFNHNTVPGHPSYKGEPAKIAAMATPRVIEGEGLVFENIRWNDEGRAHRQDYPDLSPAIKLDADGEVIFCHSGALARNGAVPDLHLCSALPGDLADKLSTLTAIPTQSNQAMLDLLKKLLKLPADATEADVTTALEAFIAAAEKAETVPAEAADDVKTMSAAVLKGLATLKAELAGQIETLNARFDGQLREQIVAEATATGRVVPASWLPAADGKGGLPIAELKTLCATLPEVVPMERRTPKNITALSAGASTQTAADRQVMQTLGITEEQWKKHA